MHWLVEECADILQPWALLYSWVLDTCSAYFPREIGGHHDEVHLPLFDVRISVFVHGSISIRGALGVYRLAMGEALVLSESLLLRAKNSIG